MSKKIKMSFDVSLNDVSSSSFSFHSIYILHGHLRRELLYSTAPSVEPYNVSINEELELDTRIEGCRVGRKKYILTSINGGKKHFPDQIQLVADFESVVTDTLKRVIYLIALADQDITQIVVLNNGVETTFHISGDPDMGSFYAELAEYEKKCTQAANTPSTEPEEKEEQEKSFFDGISEIKWTEVATAAVGGFLAGSLCLYVYKKFS
ncbi:MAG: hypothetical protein M0R77_01210 [Gammaproteobacteria bacterium]|nr:hypothetical protein [Acholeplasmataceae bacterium]MCK9529175.1 hypothetical protein [Gammaproteobacteria bacterium]